MERETFTVTVCGTSSPASAPLIDALVSSVSDAGRWGVIPLHWPDPIAWESAQRANAFVVYSNNICPQLVAGLQRRAPTVPVIAIGAEPVPELQPAIWLPEPPAAPLLASLLIHLLDEPVRADPHPAWRRKSDMIIGTSPQLRQVVNVLDQLAAAATPVLVTGESGVGKELVASELHICGPRAREPFVAVNCAAIPEALLESELFGHVKGAFTDARTPRQGLFLKASGGTLFLDEIGELPLAMQAKLLRVLETGEVQRIGTMEPKFVKLRVVSATNRELDKDVEAGRFREDLYYRIVVYPLHVPPLRERPEDIPPLVSHQLSVIARRENRPLLRLTPAALEKLIGYRWPGNVRELVNLLERAVLLAEGNVVDVEHIAFGGATAAAEAMPVAYRDAKAKFEYDYYSQLLRTAGGNISLAAKLGQKTRKEIYDALRRVGLDLAPYRDS
jgi:two-component system response regulator GlrR